MTTKTHLERQVNVLHRLPSDNDPCDDHHYTENDYSRGPRAAVSPYKGRAKGQCHQNCNFTKFLLIFLNFTIHDVSNYSNCSHRR